MSDTNQNPIFDEKTLPDYAFLTAKETAQAFGWCTKTLEKYQDYGHFPQPTIYPWGKAYYNVGAVREFLRGVARREVGNVKSDEVIKEGGKMVKKAQSRKARQRLLRTL